ncbi:Formate/nitrite transporter [Armillaria luteobubalina]|uniref:Formate/nitrite transporter n=1 Tax=Armillaria luteobubalina TaxID=153913 RepID=A0AA39UZI1_9AGAR|nr:Formate/nitrite transporter [Armillaria luteobubalina]
MDASPTLSPAQVARYMVESGVAKHRDRYENVFFKAVLAGVMLSFGGLLSEVISGGATALTLSDPGIVKILGGFVFPVGLVMIVLQGLELLTSNMMIFPMAVITRAVPVVESPYQLSPRNLWEPRRKPLLRSDPRQIRSITDSGIVSTDPYSSYIQEFALKKAADPHWHQIFLRGIGCNWLQAAGARDTLSKIVAIWIPIWVFVACSFDHVVANMFSVPLGIMFGADLTTAQYIRKSLIAAYLGNIVGALLVGLPATYFYLRDYDASGLRAAENGDSIRENSLTDKVDDKRI